MGFWLHPLVSEGQRLVIAFLLFFQFVKVSPHDLKLSRWHLYALAIQILSFLLLALLVAYTGGTLRMLLECAMLCMVCPTASAAGVITDRLGGDLAGTVSYVVLINVAATFLIPLVIPLVNPSATMDFWVYVGHIALKVFPVLIPRNVRLGEAPSHGKPISVYDPRSLGGAAYEALAKEIIRKNKEP